MTDASLQYLLPSLQIAERGSWNGSATAQGNVQGLFYADLGVSVTPHFSPRPLRRPHIHHQPPPQGAERLVELVET